MPYILLHFPEEDRERLCSFALRLINQEGIGRAPPGPGSYSLQKNTAALTI